MLVGRGRTLLFLFQLCLLWVQTMITLNGTFPFSRLLPPLLACPECPRVPLAKQQGRLSDQVGQTLDLTDAVPRD